MNPLNSLVDDIICINLKERTDRREWVTKVLNTLQLKFRFHTIERDPLGGRHGCFQSHLDVIQECYNKGYTKVLLLEDDLLPSPSYSKALVQKACDLMKHHENAWDLFYLGYFPLSNPQTLDVYAYLAAPYVDSHMIKFNPLATHAYCISRRGMKKVLDRYKSYIDTHHFDVFLASQPLESYCLTPLLFEQKLCLTTDNGTYSVVESIARNQQCNAERVHLLHLVSNLKHNMHSLHTATASIELIVLTTLLFLSALTVMCISQAFKSK